ncbi:hypothetical protein BN381_10142 [Candidatus Microthrix parvicella RN1]|uniref:Uncharacterized protein n=1 Tax=Candidatus Neomicrothrix parvicella RN1 TaxID=1229780 RepID=R4YY99_9ACTN|nr:hypothetical protein BN381_10142 [Candidatus Microthrix parvicella RN1]
MLRTVVLVANLGPGKWLGGQPDDAGAAAEAAARSSWLVPRPGRVEALAACTADSRAVVRHLARFTKLTCEAWTQRIARGEQSGAVAP